MAAAVRGGNVASNPDPYRVPWFADCAPSLLTNRTIRRHLDAYSQHTWPEVIKLTLIYGILGLEQQFPGGTLSIPQLRQLVERGGAQLVVERTLPGLQRQILGLQTNLDAVFDRLAVDVRAATEGRMISRRTRAPPAPRVQHAGMSARCAGSQQQLSNQQRAQQQQEQRQQHQHQHQHQQQHQQQLNMALAPSSAAPGLRPTSALNPGPVAPKPSDEWRQGEKTGFPSPPRAGTHPLRRSLDNQGATNPIYPDWWLAAGAPDPPAPQQVVRKVPRKQPRLAYSVQQPQQQSKVGAVDDDLVTAEYLMVPGSGYGQQQGQPVSSGVSPPVMLTSITADSMHTNPLYQHVGAQLPTANTSVAAATGGAGAVAAAAATVAPALECPAGVKQSRQPQAVQSKIREAVAASRRKAAAQQQRRQQLLTSAVAAGSTVFGTPAGSSHQQQQEVTKSSTAAAEAVAACASAGAAEQFLSNPWTSWFLEPAAYKSTSAAGGHANLPSADITADDEARLGAIREDQPIAEEPCLRAPAAYAALQTAVAAAQGAAAPASSFAVDMLQPVEGVVPAGSSAGPQSWQTGQVGVLQAGGSVVRSPGAVGPDPLAGSSSSSSMRNVFADITSAFNSQPAAASSVGVSKPLQAPPPPGGMGAAGEETSTTGTQDWQSLPLIDEEAELLQQAPQQQQPQQHRKAWAADFGHLQHIEVQAAPSAARQRRAAGKPHKRWSETWVGDFGHLEQYPRFARAALSQHQQGSDSEKGDLDPAGSPQPSGKLFMSPADLQHLVTAAERLKQDQAAHVQHAAAAQDSRQAAGGSHTLLDNEGSADLGASSLALDGPAAPGGSQGADAASPTLGLAARFAQLLSRWDAQAASSDLPAGVAARAAVSHAAAGATRGDTAASGAGDTQARRAVNASTTSLAGASSSAADSAEVDGLLAAELQAHTTAGASTVVAAADAAALLRDLQVAMTELSSTSSRSEAGDTETVGEPAVQVAAAAAKVPSGSQGAEQEASSSRGPAEGHLEGMQEASQMLQQALSRHDALMQLIASLGPAAGSNSEALLSSTASGSELTL